MSFESVAREIVANSIRSAICIDDEFVEPYKEKDGKVKDIDKPKKLTETFRQSDCTLDIHTYTSYPEFKKEENFIFKNRDLLILDWELTDDPVKFKDTLEILRDAAESPGLAFVLIYTKEPGLAGIELQIRSFFNSIFKNEKERKKAYDNLLENMDEEFFEVESEKGMPDSAGKYFDKNIGIFKDFVLKVASDESIKYFEQELEKTFIKKKIGEKFVKLFQKTIKEAYEFDGLYECCEQLIFHMLPTIINPDAKPDIYNCSKIDGTYNTLFINNTYISVLGKLDIIPEDVYGTFSDNLCRNPGNIMSLIAMEMKNNFRENAGKVGKDLLAVDELAFFHHRKNLPDEEEFYHFLRNNWKHQVASFHLNSDSKVFPVLPEYIANNKIKEEINKRVNGNKFEEFQNDLAKLNFQYSFHHAQRKEKDYIRFGDIFSVRESVECDEIEGYLLNITAQCDCLRPDKINYNFQFVLGTKENDLKKALKNVNNEKVHYSFLLLRKNEPLCISISWETKPFTIFIPEKKRFFSPNKAIKIKIEEKTKYLVYIESLLENYTQRIANQSFAHAARVGVDLAKL
ncbi:MAG: hypothetical protein KAT34_19140 [Candidatus Aminicenantes bacterium]|nr:hypothetical protein [Candidatus Aminicenantes bacterium]